MFAAALIIDRDGILAEKARDELARQVRGHGEAVAVAVSLPGASGFRTEAVEDTPLPYVYVFAMAPHDLALDGGLIVTVRCASPEWPAADAILRSLKILSRGGKTAANDAADAIPGLPLIGSRNGD